LVASEPLVIDPVAFEWGRRKLWWLRCVIIRRAWIARSAGGVIKYLEDTNGDGRYESDRVLGK
jgi:hypothetical protein